MIGVRKSYELVLDRFKVGKRSDIGGHASMDLI
jgi:hypothetical protein